MLISPFLCLVVPEQYFKNLNYELPPGESIADWLIDISSGRLGWTAAPSPDSPPPSQTEEEGETTKESGDPDLADSKHLSLIHI